MDLTTPARKDDCIFCQIVAGETETVIVEEDDHHVAFEPLNPFTPGHLLFVPRVHIEGPIESAALTGRITEMAVRYAQQNWASVDPDFNVIMSNGRGATQTMMHLHVHLIPRDSDDDSGWPWYGPPNTGFQKRP